MYEEIIYGAHSLIGCFPYYQRSYRQCPKDQQGKIQKYFIQKGQGLFVNNVS
jgi:hypothetical protein